MTLPTLNRLARHGDVSLTAAVQAEFGASLSTLSNPTTPTTMIHDLARFGARKQDGMPVPVLPIHTMLSAQRLPFNLSVPYLRATMREIAENENDGTPLEILALYVSTKQPANRKRHACFLAVGRTQVYRTVSDLPLSLEHGERYDLTALALTGRPFFGIVFAADKEAFERVVARALEAFRITGFERKRIHVEMDLLAADGRCPLDWQKLGASNDDDFLHDIVGIHLNLDRKTGRMGTFLPRCAYPA